MGREVSSAVMLKFSYDPIASPGPTSKKKRKSGSSTGSKEGTVGLTPLEDLLFPWEITKHPSESSDTGMEWRKSIDLVYSQSISSGRQLGQHGRTNRWISRSELSSVSTTESGLCHIAYLHRLPMDSCPSSCAVFRRSKQATRRDCPPTNSQESEVGCLVL